MKEKIIYAFIGILIILFILGGIVFGLYLSVILIKFIVIAGFITLTVLIFKNRKDE
jgi:hypothetical protein